MFCNKEPKIASNLKGKSIDIYLSQKITGLQQLMENNSFLLNVYQPVFDLDEFLSDPLSQSGNHHNAVKRGLISESFSLWLNPQKICQIRMTIFSLKVSKSQN